MQTIAEFYVERGERRGHEKGLALGIQQGIQEGIQEGMQQGMQQGHRQAHLEFVKSMLTKGFDRKRIAELSNLSLEYVQGLELEQEQE